MERVVTTHQKELNYSGSRFELRPYIVSDPANREPDHTRGGEDSPGLQPWRERLRGKRALLYTGGVKSWSIVSALQDLKMVVVATGTTKSAEEDKKRIRELMGSSVRMIDDGNPRAS